MKGAHGLIVARNLVGTALGAALMLAGITLIALSALSQRNFAEAAAHHGGAVIDLGVGTASPGHANGHMVRVNGTPRVLEPPLDPEFNLRADTPVLTRHVEMFEWHEVHIGERVQYEQDWMDEWLDARNFREPQGHVNPQRFPLTERRFDAPRVVLGRFQLAPALLRALPGSMAVAPDLRALPGNLAASFGVNGTYLQSSREPTNPQLGDLRIAWDGIPLQEITLVARLDGERLVPAGNAPDGQGYQVALGNVGLRALFPDLPSPPEAVVVKRVLAVALAVLGAFLLLGVRRQADVVPTPALRRRRLADDILMGLALGVLAVGAVAGAVWFGQDPQLAAWWGGAAAAGALLAALQWHRVYR